MRRDPPPRQPYLGPLRCRLGLYRSLDLDPQPMWMTATMPTPPRAQGVGVDVGG